MTNKLLWKTPGSLFKQQFPSPGGREIAVFLEMVNDKEDSINMFRNDPFND
ncbi:hypothetical protein ACPPVU_12625 [Mucilaginibacter sp. McL0603]|uniref:hypothetical protein n=1 Tax=Mucilaginibacter sp. McL0603 TaxID=3415670 RepID=UPI003CFA3149